MAAPRFRRSKVWCSDVPGSLQSLDVCRSNPVIQGAVVRQGRSRADDAVFLPWSLARAEDRPGTRNTSDSTSSSALRRVTMPKDKLTRPSFWLVDRKVMSPRHNGRNGLESARARAVSI